MVCLDTRDYIPDFQRLAPPLEFFKPPDAPRGYLLSRCLNCGTRPPLKTMSDPPCERVNSHDLELFLSHFGP